MSKFFKKIGLKPKNIPANETTFSYYVRFPDLQGDTDNARYNRELLEGIILKSFSYKQKILGQEINDYGYKYFIIKFFDDDIDTTIFTGKDKSEALEDLATQISDEIKEECLNTDWRY